MGSVESNAIQILIITFSQKMIRKEMIIVTSNVSLQEFQIHNRNLRKKSFANN